MPDDDDDTSGGFAVPLPAGMAAAMIAHAHEHQDAADLHRAALRMRVDAFLDHLTVDQLMTMRTMLNQHKPRESNQYFDGQIVTLLRRVHHVDPDSGKSLDEELLERGAAVKKE